MGEGFGKADVGALLSHIPIGNVKPKKRLGNVKRIGKLFRKFSSLVS